MPFSKKKIHNIIMPYVNFIILTGISKRNSDFIIVCFGNILVF